jgi:hypothetical protein
VTPPSEGPIIGAVPAGDPGRVEVRRPRDRPRLTTVTREGDPSPAIAAVFVTDAGPALTAALAAVVEVRVRAAGFDVDVRVDRDAFRVRVLCADATRVPALLAALASATSRPVAKGGAEAALAMERLQSLRRNPLDAAELAPVAACTGALGIAPGDALPDLASDAGLAELAARQASLVAERVAIASVGPLAFGTYVASMLERSEGWATTPSTSAPPAWPTGDVAGVYTAPALERRSARLTVAVRVSDPLVAAAAAERLGAPDSPLAARLAALPQAWRVAQVAGVAQPRGGCVALVLETAQHAASITVEGGAAFAAAVARLEVSAELALGAAPSTATRQILAALDPRDAASRAAWWGLAGAEPGATARWITALGIPSPEARSPRDSAAAATDPAADARFGADVERAAASAAGGANAAERRVSVEHGQGEVWVLLASPCGVAEEGTGDAGLGALAILAAVEQHRRAEGVSLLPWITSDGLGILAHAHVRDERESPAELARRVANAAARALLAPAPSSEAYSAARAAVLDHVERSSGPQGAALGALALSAAPEHPSWLEPFGLWPKVAGAGAEAVRLRAVALANGPLRVAVLANADAAQASGAADAVERWLSPAPGPRMCRGPASAPPRPGRVEAHLPDGAPTAQGLVGVPLPGAAWRELAELTASALDGPGGLLAAAFPDAIASARVLGGARSPLLLVDLRTAPDRLPSAVAEAKTLLARLATSASDADLARAAAVFERRERDARADPRRRVADLWTGRPASAGPRPTLDAWRAYLAATLREPSMVVVEAR